MKRNLTTVVIAVILSISYSHTQACTNFLVTKGASATGSTFISYSADSHVLYGELYFWAAAKYPAGSMLKIYEWDTNKYLGEIAQAAETFRVIGNMNEYAVAIGETTYGGRHELAGSGIIDYGSLIYITLQRSRNAREAIKTICGLLNTYGYASEGESFSISDPNEVWILEMIGKGKSDKGAVWVAVRIPDGYVSGHANHARITAFPLEGRKVKNSISSKNIDKIFNPEVEYVYAEDVISFARTAGYFTGTDAEFSFSDVYAPLDFSAARACEARVWSFFKQVNSSMWEYEDYALGHNLKHRMPLYIKPDKKLSLEDVKTAMRDHYEGTKMDMTTDIGAGAFKCPYRWRPMEFEFEGKSYVHERATATQQTGFWFIAEGRSWLPNPIGGILWFSVDDAATSCLTPIYCGMTKVPEIFAVGNGDLLTYSDRSAFWLFNRVTNFVYSRYDVMSKDVLDVQKRFESESEQLIGDIDKSAAALYAGNAEEAISAITEFSLKRAQEMFDTWKKLDVYLLVKYIDGNIKKERGGKFERTEDNYPVSPEQPKLPEFWIKKIVEDNGDILQIPQES
ncbi:MAG: C69 family dipeptidase [Prevotellaceae bacterium]|jgi:dipeptidase|nr:C69 family dipeptidase [Prevotellaceae bacterium]